MERNQELYLSPKLHDEAPIVRNWELVNDENLRNAVNNLLPVNENHLILDRREKTDPI